MRHRKVWFAGLLTLLCVSSIAHALYDPPPEAALASAEGGWSGTLTYKDYQKPDRRVTLPTQLYAALLGSGEVALHFVFDDGPGKTVQSYERLRFDWPGNKLTWQSGADERSEWAVSSVSREKGVLHVVAERFKKDEDGERWLRSRFAFGPTEIVIEEDDGPSKADLSFRNRYAFARGATR